MRHPSPVADTPPFDPTLVVVQDTTQPCPYLLGREARMPLQWPTRPIDAAEFDRYMESGFRRSGQFVYNTACAGCQACEPTRVLVEQFRWTRSFRRVLKRGDDSIDMVISDPQVDLERLTLLNRHRSERELGQGTRLSLDDYRCFLIESCCETRELTYWYQNKLAAVATIDLGVESVSAVYCFFDPSLHRFSLGTYSILKQIQLAQNTSRQYLYLGMYVANNSHLNYKARFQPQERLVGQTWICVDHD
jgi:arginine-tRNA-protein transferase